MVNPQFISQRALCLVLLMLWLVSPDWDSEALAPNSLLLLYSPQTLPPYHTLTLQIQVSTRTRLQALVLSFHSTMHLRIWSQPRQSESVHQRHSGTYYGPRNQTPRVGVQAYRQPMPDTAPGIVTKIPYSYHLRVTPSLRMRHCLTWTRN